ncbi:hypothetical protein [Pontibacter vulgaris]|uniref:hypothetical protein n=1 Tax=Pontibacter vulgaris TaxID=2905679 RepID=UPI001FA72536|nr:hypothetical protein [Pontibacter vulgaris]
MKTGFLNRLPLMLAFGCTLVFAGCQKDEETSDQSLDVESAEANAMAETEFTSLDEFVTDVAKAEPEADGRIAVAASLPGCATATFNKEARTIIIDFGTTNCTCPDGLKRRGKIVASFSGTPFTVGSSFTVTLQDYFVNDNQLKGTKVSTYLGNHKISVKVSDASITTPGGTATWSADRVIEQVAGTGTLLLSDDVWQVTGSAAGVNRKGIAYTAEIKQPLKRVLSAGCARNFVAGIISITNTNGKTMELNYDPTGKEPCDKIAEVTINGKAKLITLR